ncbi:hypothetical protein BKA66DRAFT_442881 [Pyrenochaeta sp. MPI-SDFR-AT-0127]|nr:hypothetical protein BKA66DRAFT_442881 [Pyrenochaeta sp. MPI-SDFR-AT-0127]
MSQAAKFHARKSASSIQPHASNQNHLHSAAQFTLVERIVAYYGLPLLLLRIVDIHIMAKPKTINISGPMNAKHVGGVNVGGNSGSILDSYFANSTLEPDETPSHTYVAIGTTEVPRRSNTIASVIRQPSVSLKNSLSHFRTSSTSHLTDLYRKHDVERQANIAVTRSKSAKQPQPLRMQSSMSRLRQRVGLDRDIHAPISVSKPIIPDPEVAPAPPQKDYPSLKSRASLARLTTAPSNSTDSPEVHVGRATSIQYRQASTFQRQSSTIIKHSSNDQQQQKRPSPAIQRQLSNLQTEKQLPVRPKRADSGTAIDLDDVPVQQRPIPFKQILAEKSFTRRMALYKKTRDYWATADHGLIEWTERATGPRVVASRS